MHKLTVALVAVVCLFSVFCVSATEIEDSPLDSLSPVSISHGPQHPLAMRFASVRHNINGIFLKTLKSENAKCTEECTSGEGECAQACSHLLGMFATLNAAVDKHKGDPATCSKQADGAKPADAMFTEYVDFLASLMTERKPQDEIDTCIKAFGLWAKDHYSHAVGVRICGGEYHQAFALAKEYEGSLKGLITKQLKAMGQKDPNVLAATASMAASHVTTAFQTFEFQRLGNKLYSWKPVQYIARLLLQRVLTFVQAVWAVPNAKPSGFTQQPLAVLGQTEGGIGFVCPPEDKKGNAAWLNAAFPKTSARSWTSIAYHTVSVIMRAMNAEQLATLAKGAPKAINGPLLAKKSKLLRCNIFSDKSNPLHFPLTTQPPGWPWLKYYSWNKLPLTHGKSVRFIETKKDSATKCMIPPTALHPPTDDLEAACGRWTPGTDLWAVENGVLPDPSKLGKKTGVDWTQQLRDKGLVALAGPSSTTSAMMEYARLLNFDAHELELYRLLMVVWMVQARDHSYSEIFGAFDAYHWASTRKFGTPVAGDSSMAWHMRVSKKWHEAYNKLLPAAKYELPAIPAFKGKLTPTDDAELEVPGFDKVTVDPAELNELLTGKKDESCYPSYYGERPWLEKLIAYNTAQDHSSVKSPLEEDECGLLNERIDYCSVDIETYGISNVAPLKLSPRPKVPESRMQGPGYLDKDQFAAFGTYLHGRADKQKLLTHAVEWLTLAFAAESVAETRVLAGHINPIYEIFVAESATANLGDVLCDVAPDMKDDPKTAIGGTCVYAIIDAIQHKKLAVPAFVATLMKPEHKDAATAFFAGLSLAAVRLYTQEGDSVINFEYGSSKPNDKPEIQFETLMKKKGYSLKAIPLLKKEGAILLELIKVAIASPLFPKKNTVTWHGVQEPALESAIASIGKQWNFPGFKVPGVMSTSYDLTSAAGYAVAKDATLQINANAMGAFIEDLSAAPGEREVIYPPDVKFIPKRVCYATMKIRDDVDQKTRQGWILGGPKDWTPFKDIKVSATKGGAHSDECAQEFKDLLAALAQVPKQDAMSFRLVSLDPVPNADFTTPGRPERKEPAHQKPIPRVDPLTGTTGGPPPRPAPLGTPGLGQVPVTPALPRPLLTNLGGFLEAVGDSILKGDVCGNVGTYTKQLEDSSKLPVVFGFPVAKANHKVLLTYCDPSGAKSDDGVDGEKISFYPVTSGVDCATVDLPDEHKSAELDASAYKPDAEWTKLTELVKSAWVRAPLAPAKAQPLVEEIIKGSQARPTGVRLLIIEPSVAKMQPNGNTPQFYCVKVTDAKGSKIGAHKVKIDKA